MMESLIAFRPAGASGVLTYFSSQRRRSRLKQHLPDILAVLNEMMGRGSFVEVEDPGDLRLDHPLFPQSQQLIHPGPDAVKRAPHVTQIDAEDPLLAFISESGLNWTQGVFANIDTMPRYPAPLPTAADEAPNTPRRPVGARMR
jgi:hypothetical protein